MKTILIMPVKRNSIRLKDKNILLIKNIPMFVFTMREAQKCKLIDDFYVSTESKKIKEICKKYEIKFLNRSKRLAGKNIEKQEVIVESLKILKRKKIIPKTVISIQANSPELKVSQLNKAINFFIYKLHPNSKIKELITVNAKNIQDAAFRIMTYKAAFQKSLSTKLGVFKTDLTDIHSLKEYKLVKKRIEKKV